MIDLVTDGQPLMPWRLYPGESGIFDRLTYCQFYYHSHGSELEAGHFHTVRLFADHTVHLVAMSMTPGGWPQALFTLNLWAIGDAYEAAGNLRRDVHRFHLREQVGPRPLVRFVNLMFQTFGPEIERLQDEKIAALAAHQAAHPGRDVFADRSLEITSRVEIDLRARADDSVPAIPHCSRGEKDRMTRSMRLLSLVLLLAALWLATSSAAADLDALMREFRVTPTGLKAAPAFSLKTLEGKTAALADHRGRAVVLYFWATW